MLTYHQFGVVVLCTVALLVGVPLIIFGAVDNHHCVDNIEIVIGSVILLHAIWVGVVALINKGYPQVGGVLSHSHYYIAEIVYVVIIVGLIISGAGLVGVNSHHACVGWCLIAAGLTMVLSVVALLAMLAIVVLTEKKDSAPVSSIKV